MKCQPIFSPEDSDLAQSAWHSHRDGYAQRTIKNRLTEFAHRIVASRKFGPLTSQDICDHANRIRLDNRRENLRLVNHSQNSQNKTRSEFCGTTLHKCGKWQAAVGFNGKTVYLGLFTDRSEAARVAATKRQELGFFV